MAKKPAETSTGTAIKLWSYMTSIPIATMSSGAAEEVVLQTANRSKLLGVQCRSKNLVSDRYMTS
jgi:hypothetical protein